MSKYYDHKRDGSVKPLNPKREAEDYCKRHRFNTNGECIDCSALADEYPESIMPCDVEGKK